MRALLFSLIPVAYAIEIWPCTPSFADSAIQSNFPSGYITWVHSSDPVGVAYNDNSLVIHSSDGVVRAYSNETAVDVIHHNVKEYFDVDTYKLVHYHNHTAAFYPPSGPTSFVNSVSRCSIDGFPACLDASGRVWYWDGSTKLSTVGSGFTSFHTQHARVLAWNSTHKELIGPVDETVANACTDNAGCSSKSVSRVWTVRRGTLIEYTDGHMEQFGVFSTGFVDRDLLVRIVLDGGVGSMRTSDDTFFALTRAGTLVVYGKETSRSRAPFLANVVSHDHSMSSGYVLYESGAVEHIVPGESGDWSSVITDAIAAADRVDRLIPGCGMAVLSNGAVLAGLGHFEHGYQAVLDPGIGPDFGDVFEFNGACIMSYGEGRWFTTEEIFPEVYFSNEDYFERPWSFTSIANRLENSTTVIRRVIRGNVNAFVLCDEGECESVVAPVSSPALKIIGSFYALVSIITICNVL